MEPVLQKTFEIGTKATRSFSSSVQPPIKRLTVELAFPANSLTTFLRREILDHVGKSVRLDRLRAGGPLLVDHDPRGILLE
jgi:hypothetical protein